MFWEVVLRWAYNLLILIKSKKDMSFFTRKSSPLCKRPVVGSATGEAGDACDAVLKRVTRDPAPGLDIIKVTPLEACADCVYASVHSGETWKPQIMWCYGILSVQCRPSLLTILH